MIHIPIIFEHVLVLFIFQTKGQSLDEMMMVRTENIQSFQGISIINDVQKINETNVDFFGHNLFFGVDIRHHLWQESN